MWDDLHGSYWTGLDDTSKIVDHVQISVESMFLYEDDDASMYAVNFVHVQQI